MNERILQELQEIKSILLFQKEIWTLDEFCSYTGYSKDYAYHLTSKEKIKFSRPSGKLIFFEKSDVLDFLRQNPVTPHEDLEKFARKRLIEK